MECAQYLYLNGQVVAVIQQPRYETLRLFDDLVLPGTESTAGARD